ncbi:class I mannose-6-phosphate isomerase [Streptomyces sp. NPDC001978]|uniref:class I mannose-6-phosphate isomerase n=1 Tax=Streptomyces sp. NPDC001978 TaxID=3364627 RepID=UPI0036A7DB83
MPISTDRRYEPEPTYPLVQGELLDGWDTLVACLPGDCVVLAVDGPQILDWTALSTALRTAAARRYPSVVMVDLREQVTAWDTFVKRTAPVAALEDDPDFATLASGTLDELFDQPPAAAPLPDTLVIVYGPGAALTGAGTLWYADLPKRYAEAAVTAGTGRNLGQREGDGPATTRRLFYIDWPLLDRHRDALAGRIDRWIDVQDPARPVSAAGDDLRATLRSLARRPFRTRPTFNTTTWGGHWAQRELGHNPGAVNTALGYELIAPESGILLGGPGQRPVEVPFQLLTALAPDDLLGDDVHRRFGSSFPIRFDYLDTMGGGHLSVHCHPRDDYMREVFGWPYTQHESYYLMVGAEDGIVHLGLREGVDVTSFEEHAHAAEYHGTGFDITRFVQTFPADEHQLYLIPAGTPHGSGEGNVVLEISATPYLYSLRFYDWLRKDSADRPRPVHVRHAFDNLDTRRTGRAVAEDLVQRPREADAGPGWQDLLIGSLPEMFFEVHRLELEPRATAPQDTAGRFHVLNVVAGDAVSVECGTGEHRLNYAETLVVPAAAGAYRVTAGERSARVVKAFVR